MVEITCLCLVRGISLGPPYVLELIELIRDILVQGALSYLARLFPSINSEAL